MPIGFNSSPSALNEAYRLNMGVGLITALPLSLGENSYYTEKKRLNFALLSEAIPSPTFSQVGQAAPRITSAGPPGHMGPAVIRCHGPPRFGSKSRDFVVRVDLRASEASGIRMDQSPAAHSKDGPCDS